MLSNGGTNNQSNRGAAHSSSSSHAAPSSQPPPAEHNQAGQSDNRYVDGVHFQRQKHGQGFKTKSKKKRSRNRKSCETSKLYVYFANITQLFSKSNHERAFLPQRSGHVVGVAETDLNKVESAKEYKEFTKAGWTVSYSPATPSEDSSGSRGGAWLMHKPWLHSAVPIEVESDARQVLPEGDIAWKLSPTSSTPSG